MFVPEYSITPKTLKNISEIEYGRSIIENTSILPTLEKKLQKEAKTKILVNSLETIGLNYPTEEIKKIIDGLKPEEKGEIKSILGIFSVIKELSRNTEIEDTDLKYINVELTKETLPRIKQGVYRSKNIDKHTAPEEIPARLVQFFDWYNGLDAKETHPIIAAAITKAVLEQIWPFENFNGLTADIMVYLSLNSRHYGFGDYISVESYYKKAQKEYENQLSDISLKNADFTRWIEFFSEGLASETSNIREKIKSLARDSKIAKATGKTKLTPRQERIIEYLQDYGMLQNRDFGQLFSDVSEDSILRDIKSLMIEGVIVKRGSTKSSRYELS